MEQIRKGQGQDLTLQTHERSWPSVTEAFQAACHRFPELPAILCDAGTIKYRDLATEVEVVSARLADLGLVSGDVCCVASQRSPDAIAAFLAISRLGAVYAPIDPAYPASQIASMLVDCNSRLCLVDANSRAVVAEAATHAVQAGAPLAELVALSDLGTGDPADKVPPRADLSGDAPLCVMFTSGSSGAPKGVVIPHRAVVSLCQDQDFVRAGPGVTFLHMAPLAFDASTLEIFAPLLSGGSLAILPDSTPSLDQIAETLRRYAVTTAWFTSGVFHALIDTRIDAFDGLDEVIAGGDVLSPAHVARLATSFPRLQIINGYGPTENTTFTCCWRIPTNWPGLRAAVPIPIGPPIQHREIAVVGPDLAPVAKGETGELVCSGPGLALGYLNRPELNARAFIDDPNLPGRRLYRTGDLVRQRPDGVVDFLGRADRQVKVSGRRIELDEIEQTLLAAPDVSAAAVVTFGNPGTLRIAAFVSPVDKAGIPIFRDKLARHLEQHLPLHMIPVRIDVRPSLPLTSAGKVDRKALKADLNNELDDGARTARAASDPADLAATIAGILGRTIGLTDLPTDRPFFDLGFRSLDLVRAHAVLGQTITVPVSLVDLFTYPTVNGLTAHLRAETPASRPVKDSSRQLSGRNEAIARARASRGAGIAGSPKS